MIKNLLTLGFIAGSAMAQPLVSIDTQANEFFYALHNNEHQKVLVIGDSISFRPESWHKHFQHLMWDNFGHGGDGYLSFSNGHQVSNGIPNFTFDYMTDRSLLTMWQNTVNGGEIERMKVSGDRLVDINGDPVDWGVLSPDGIAVRLKDNARVFGEVYDQEFYYLHFLYQPNGGIIDIYVDDNYVGGIPTDSVEEQHGVINVPFRPAETVKRSETYSVELVARQDTGWVQLHGISYEGSQGFQMDRMSRGGAGPVDFLKSDNTIARSQVESYDPDLILYMLDSSTGYNFFYDKSIQMLDTFVDPSVPVVLITHHNFNDNILLEKDVYWQIAQERGYGFINLYDLLNREEVQPFLKDVVHYNYDGGKFFGEYIFRRLYQSYQMSDWNLDGILDNGDISEYVNDFLNQEVYCDLNYDDVVDNADLNVFVQNYLNSF